MQALFNSFCVPQELPFHQQTWSVKLVPHEVVFESPREDVLNFVRHPVLRVEHVAPFGERESCLTHVLLGVTC